jgi:LEA14-like dessication related protein
VRRLLLALLLLAAACPHASIVPEPPEARVREVVELSDDEVALRFDVLLMIENPNAYACAVDAIDWELTVDDQAIARGRVTPTATLPGKLRSPLTVRLMVPAGAAARVRAALGAGGRLGVSGMLHVHGGGSAQAGTFAWRADQSEIVPAAPDGDEVP